MTNKLKGTLSIMLATVIWGSTFVAQSIGLNFVGPYTFLAVRCVLAVIILLMILFFLNRKQFIATITDPKLWKAGIPCGIALFTATALQQVGLMYTTTSKAGFITTMYIILVPIFGLFLEQKPPKTVGLGVVLAVIGLYFISGADFSAINFGDALMLGCAAAFAVQILIMDRVAGQLNSLALNMAQALVCAVLSSIFAAFFDTVVWGNIVACWFPLFYAGVLSMGFAYTLQIVGQKAIEPTTASLLMSFESVFAALSGMAATALGWLNEKPLRLIEWLGCALVFAAIMLTQIPEKSTKKAPV